MHTGIVYNMDYKLDYNCYYTKYTIKYILDIRILGNYSMRTLLYIAFIKKFLKS